MVAGHFSNPGVRGEIVRFATIVSIVWLIALLCGPAAGAEG